MDVIEILTLVLAPSISKAILKIWTKDNAMAEDIASSLLDLIKSKTGDVVAQQQGKRQLEDIGEKVAQSLVPVFEEEHVQLAKGSLDAVVIAAAKVVGGTKINPDLLLEHDLDPTRLAKYLIDSNPGATRDFSDSEEQLYRRTVYESIRYVVEIASELPDFTERTFSEILRRESELRDTVNHVLEEVQRMRTAGASALSREAGYFETEYRRSVASRLDQLELVGADVSGPSRRHSLSVAYVTILAKKTQKDIPPTLPPEQFPESEVHDQSVEDRKEVAALMADEGILDCRRLLIMGLAGSGKTTLLQWLAVRSASRTFGEQHPDWNDTIPFFIRLGQCIQSGLPRPEQFPGLIAPAIAGIMPGQWVHEQLKRGRAIVMVDGIDEVPQTDRTSVCEWMKELMESFPESRFIVTSRPHIQIEEWIGLGFDEAEIQPMDLQGIDAFIDHWHSAVRGELRNEEEKAELEPFARHLKDELRENRSVRNLATNPLLCAMICALHRDRRRRLPTDRIELYEACCYMLLERRDIERRIELRDYPKLNYRQKRLLLEDLAYYLISNRWSGISFDRADSRLGYRLQNMQDIDRSVTGSAVRRLFVERTGMIRQPAKGVIEFTHRTFQEFLAAHACRSEGNIGVLVTNADDDQWRETIILAAGLVSPSQCDELVRGILVRGDEEGNRRLHLLGLACLENSVVISPEIRSELSKRLAGLVPPTSFEDAKVLAAAKDLALPYLHNRSDYSRWTVAACVRTLSLIGGEEALRTLGEYADEQDTQVSQELVRAWDSFDRKEYAARVLSRRRNLHLDRAASLDGIEYLQSLNSLRLTNVAQYVSLKVAGSTRVSRFLDSGPRDWSPLAKLANLMELDVDGSYEISDLAFVGGLLGLKRLRIGYMHSTGDLAPLAKLINLTELRLDQMQNDLFLAPLAHLANLMSLRLTWSGRIGFAKARDLSFLTRLTRLKQLTLRGLTHVNTLKPLSQLRNLTQLTLSGIQNVGDFSPVAGLTMLASLDISNTLELEDLRFLSSLHRLTSLRLVECQRIKDLSPLRGLLRLRTLTIDKSLRTELPVEISSKRQISIRYYQ